LSETIAMLEEQRAAAIDVDLARDIEDLLHRYQHRLEATIERQNGTHPSADGADPPLRHQRRISLVRDALAAERRTLHRLRNEGTIGDEVLRHLERELDLTDVRFDSRA
jgi:hypothetical protein